MNYVKYPYYLFKTHIHRFKTLRLGEFITHKSAKNTTNVLKIQKYNKNSYKKKFHLDKTMG